MALGKNIKKRREQLGLTQSRLGELVGMTQVAIANLEKRDSKSSRNIDALVEALQTTHQQLSSGDFDGPIETSAGGASLSDNEKRLVEIARKLSQSGFETIFTVASGVLASESQNKK